MISKFESFLFSGFIVVGMAIVALFAAAPSVFAAVPTIISAKITDPGTVTVIYSEPVSTKLEDYSRFGGDLTGKKVLIISGSGSKTINLTFDTNLFAPNSSGSLTIATSTVTVSDGSSLANGAVNVTDGQPPVISSFTISSNNANNALARFGNEISISFTADEPIMSLSVSIAGHAVSVNGAGKGPYTTSYILGSGDAEGSVPVALTFYDNSGNPGSASLTLSGGSVSTPIISSITSNASGAGTLKIGDSVIFTLKPSIIQPSATVSGTYNGIPLVWSTPDGGVTYTATYTVATGHANQTVPLQISGVTLINQSGKTSAAASGSDVAKTIDVNAPIVSATPAPTAAVATSAETAAGDTVEPVKFTRALKIGSSGDDVQMLQKQLAAMGLYGGSATGYFGALTAKSVKKLQAKYKIPQLGNVGPATRNLLNRLLEK